MALFMKTELDPVRALLLVRIDAMDESFASISKKIGKNPACIQQFIARNIPRSLPEDVREILGKVIGVSPEALRGTAPARGGPKVAKAEAIATTDEEAALLAAFRALAPDLQAKTLLIVKSLG